jgi:hypothetical protein
METFAKMRSKVHILYASIVHVVTRMCAPSVTHDNLCNQGRNVDIQERHQAVCSQTYVRPHHESYDKALRKKNVDVNNMEDMAGIMWRE